MPKTSSREPILLSQALLQAWATNERINRQTVTPSQALRALPKSSEAMSKLLEQSLASSGRVRDFRPDVVGFFSYAISHEAHHGGQVCLLARQVGHSVAQEVGFGMWEWGKRWKECGFGSD